MKNTALLTAGLIFSIVCISHFLRYYYAWGITVNHHTIPLIWSIYGGVFAGMFAIFMFYSMNK